MYADTKKNLHLVETFRSRLNLMTCCKKELAALIIAICIIVVLLFSSCFTAMHFCCKCKAYDCPICLNVDDYRNGIHGAPLIIALIYAAILPALLSSFQIDTFHQKNTLFDLRIRLNN